MSKQWIEKAISRRGLFKSLGVITASAAVLGIPQKGRAGDDVDALVAKTMGSGPMEEKRVTIEAPIIAENGKVVPIKVMVDHPMDADNFIQSIAIFVDKNPIPMAAKFNLTANSGKAQVAARIKMGKTSKVRAIARTNTGKLYAAINEIKVTIGGCGG
ncbi:MAG: thiosulfate oxidation carrier protein SoxY [Magnetococcales bacterium]|nr:thiosulfate oxidation carrier protein SoxY [Magnetococcales bacterium]